MLDTYKARYFFRLRIHHRAWTQIIRRPNGNTHDIFNYGYFIFLPPIDINIRFSRICNVSDHYGSSILNKYKTHWSATIVQLISRSWLPWFHIKVIRQPTQNTYNVFFNASRRLLLNNIIILITPYQKQSSLDNQVLVFARICLRVEFCKKKGEYLFIFLS